VAPDKLVLVSKNGNSASGSFVLRARAGPVGAFTVQVPAARGGLVVVSPAKGSLQAGGAVEVTVTVTSKTALTTVLTVTPGHLTVQVTFEIAAA